MMSLPFFGLFAAFLLIGLGRRRDALFAWAFSMLALAVLFHLHATDRLHIGL